MNAPLIKVSDLTIGWEGAVLQVGANFEVHRGDVFVVLGSSGCGKSTLMRHLIGLETPISGQVSIDGFDPRQVEHGRPSFGVMFQSGAMLNSMTVWENVALPLQSWSDLPLEAIDAIVQAKLRLVGLQGTANKMPAELSGGMKKRAAIARAMALEPELIFLDEPSAGLDPVTAAELDDLILRLNRNLGLTVVVVSHDLDSICKIGTRCIMLDRDSKRIIAEGDPRVLRDTADDPRVHGFFHREAEAR
jgi:phospholipid/cholesterol/gamma-HCH transport system ATP-binding protein